MQLVLFYTKIIQKIQLLLLHTKIIEKNAASSFVRKNYTRERSWVQKIIKRFAMITELN